MKRFLVLAIAVAILTVVSHPAQSQPVCYMVGVNGAMTDLTSICGQRPASNNGGSMPPSGLFQPPIPKILKRLIYTGEGYSTYIDLNTFDAQNSLPKVGIERVFPNKTERVAVSAVCPTNQIQVNQANTYSQFGELTQSTTTGTHSLQFNSLEAGTLANFLCANTNQSV